MVKRGKTLTSYFTNKEKKEEKPAEEEEKGGEEELPHKTRKTAAKKKAAPAKRTKVTASASRLGAGVGAQEQEDADADADDSAESGDAMTTVAGVTMSSDWMKVLKPEFQKPYFKKLKRFVDDARKSTEVFPPEDEVYTAFNLTPLAKVKVCILGQDPYHDNDQAHGLSFSVKHGIKIPPSLRNMLKEAVTDVGIGKAPHGCLESWAKQGVFMLNTVLTVQAHKANSHRKKGWETFTEAAIRALNANQEHVVFMLWGKPAQTRGKFIDRSRHLVLESPHPSPLSASRGFFGCKHFSKANAYLKKHHGVTIDWNIV